MKFILTADLHIRDDQPECRIDDFEKSMWNKFKFLDKLRQKHNAIILVAGDVFHRHKPHPWLINKCLEHLPTDMYVIAGNHDLPNHSLKHLQRSGLQTLVLSEKIHLLEFEEGVPEIIKSKKQIEIYPFHYGEKLFNVEREPGILKIAMIHRLVTQTKDDLWRHTTARAAPKFIRQLHGYDIILTGDNHITFTTQYKDTTLINPGSFMRTTAAQMEHVPSVFLYDADIGPSSIKKIPLPHTMGVVSRKHLERKEQQNERMVTFVSKLNEDYELGLFFEKNIENYFEHNKETHAVRSMVWESIEQTTNL